MARPSTPLTLGPLLTLTVVLSLQVIAGLPRATGVSAKGQRDHLKGKVFLDGGTYKGTVAIHIKGHPHKFHICDSGWGDTEASVVCRSLGHRHGGRATKGEVLGPSPFTPSYHLSVRCQGHERHLLDCSIGNFGGFCAFGKRVGVDCHRDNENEETSEHPVRLTLEGGGSPHEGEVTIWVTGVKVRVCADHWDDRDARVVCRALGYSSGGVATKFQTTTFNRLPIALGQVNCTGDEGGLWECPALIGVQANDCRRGETAGVVCDVASPTTPPPAGTTETTTTTTPHEATKAIASGRKDTNSTASPTTSRPEGTSASTTSTTTTAAPQDSTRTTTTSTTTSTSTTTTAAATPTTTTTTTTTTAPVLLSGNAQCGQRPIDSLRRLTRKRRSTNASQRSTPRNAALHRFLTRQKRGSFKIMGGEQADYGAVPWHAALYRETMESVVENVPQGLFRCGATVIGDYWLISAAHCFRQPSYDPMTIDNTLVVVGDLERNVLNKEQQLFRVEHVVLHPNFTEPHLNNDIALIKIRPHKGRAIQFSTHVQPACLPDENTPETEGTACHISGWGSIGPDGPFPKMLRTAVIPIWSRARCQAAYRDDGLDITITESMLCAGRDEGGVDTCHKDSGGPLVCLIGGVYTLMGVTSWGLVCGEPPQPGVYARVSHLLPWIYETINAHSGN